MKYSMQQEERASASESRDVYPLSIFDFLRFLRSPKKVLAVNNNLHHVNYSLTAMTCRLNRSRDYGCSLPQ